MNWATELPTSSSIAGEVVCMGLTTVIREQEGKDKGVLDTEASK